MLRACVPGAAPMCCALRRSRRAAPLAVPQEARRASLPPASRPAAMSLDTPYRRAPWPPSTTNRAPCVYDAARAVRVSVMMPRRSRFISKRVPETPTPGY
jgi:hypothetical protein